MKKLMMKSKPYRDFITKNLLKFSILLFLGVTLSVAGGCKKDDAGALPQALTKDLIEIMDIEAVCGGTVQNDGGSKIVAIGLCYTTESHDPTVEDKFVAAGTYTHNGIVQDQWDFTATLTGLTPKTSYKVRAYVANEAGVAYGETKTFETKAGKTFHTLTPDMLFTFTQEVYEGPKESLVDGSYSTFWHSAWSNEVGAEVHPLPHYIQITFPEAKAIGGIQYWHRSPSGTGGRPNAWDLQTSTDGTNWTTVWVSETNLDITIMPPAANTLSLDQNYTSKYFRIRILANPSNTTYTYLSQIKVYHDGLLD